MCSKMIRKDERKARKIFKEIFCATRTRETQENRRGGFVLVWERKESFGAKKWFHMKKFFSIDRFLWIFDKFFGFRFGLNFFQLCSSRKRPHWKSDNYSLHTSTIWPKERNRREKPRNRYDQTESFSRVKMRRALTFCCPSFLRAFKRVYIYIYLMYKSRFPQFKGVSFPQFSRSRGD